MNDLINIIQCKVQVLVSSSSIIDVTSGAENEKRDHVFRLLEHQIRNPVSVTHNYNEETGGYKYETK